MNMSPHDAAMTLLLVLLGILGVAFLVWCVVTVVKAKQEVRIDLAQERAALSSLLDSGAKVVNGGVQEPFPMRHDMPTEADKVAKIAALRHRLEEERKSPVPDLTLISSYKRRIAQIESE